MVETVVETKRRGPRPRARVVVPCNLRLEQVAGLRHLSDERDLPMAILIREAIDRFLIAEIKPRAGK